MTELNLQGLTPMRYWKLFEFEGVQALAYIDWAESEEGYSVVIETAYEQNGAPVGMRITTQCDATAKVIFHGLDDAEKVVKSVVNQTAAVVASVFTDTGPELADTGYEVSRATVDLGGGLTKEVGFRQVDRSDDDS